eukprot:ctg_2043.g416
MGARQQKVTDGGAVREEERVELELVGGERARHRRHLQRWPRRGCGAPVASRCQTPGTRQVRQHALQRLGRLTEPHRLPQMARQHKQRLVFVLITATAAHHAVVQKREVDRPPAIPTVGQRVLRSILRHLLQALLTQPSRLQRGVPCTQTGDHGREAYQAA